MQVWIGTSGYSYADWVGDFYPRGTRSENMLPYYARFFPLVELNFTFYRPPTPEILLRLANKAPASFQFLVKLPRSLSHEQRTDDLNTFSSAVAALHRRKQLRGLLCQLPQSTHYEKKSLTWLKTLGKELAPYHLAVEFRHRSWWREDVPSWMAEQHLDMVAVDVPDVPNLFPRGWVQSGPRAYVRLHSRLARNWYNSDKERYDYQYSDAELLEWVRAMNAEEKRTDEVLVLFNNCFRGQAITNARGIRELIAEHSPQAEIVPPVAESPPRQGTLFD